MRQLQNAMTQRAMLAAAQKISRMHGLVQSYDPGTYSVKVALQPSGTLTGWIPIETHAIGNGWGVAYGPAIGDQAIVDFADGDPEAATVSGFIYSDQDRPPPVPSGELWTVHKSGAFVKLTNDGKLTLVDKAGSTVVLNGDNTGTMSFSAGLTINANTQINGTLKASGDITDNSGTNSRTMAGMRSVYNTHTHPVTNVQGGSSTITSNAPNQTE